MTRNPSVYEKHETDEYMKQLCIDLLFKADQLKDESEKEDFTRFILDIFKEWIEI